MGDAARPHGSSLQDGWLLQQGELFTPRAPGNTNLSALSRFAFAPEAALHAINGSKGCGAIMRTAPLAFVAEVEEAFAWAVQSGRITHGHPSGTLSAGYFAALLHGLLRDVDWERAHETAWALLERDHRSEETCRAIEAGMRLARRGEVSAEEIQQLGGGWTGESALAIALAVGACARVSNPDQFVDVLWRGAAHGGDSDSTATLVGQLLGARYGMRVIPTDWIDQLELHEVIQEIAADIHASLVNDQALSFYKYPPH